jgi:hypothetical protein
MKKIKAADKGIGKSRRNDGCEVLFQRTVCKELNAALLLPKPVPPKQARSARSRGSFRFGSGRAWLTLVHNLDCGIGGPAIPGSIVRTMVPCAKDFYGELRTASTARLMFSTSCPYEEKGAEEYENSSRRLQCGHCIQLLNGIYAQVLVPVVHDAGHESSFVGFRALVTPFTFMNTDAHLHPEIPLPWLKRCEPARSQIILVSTIRKRVHIVPLFEDEDDGSPCGDYAQSFLVNEFAEPLRSGVRDSDSFLICPQADCGNKIPRPHNGIDVMCDKCGFKTQW